MTFDLGQLGQGQMMKTGHNFINNGRRDSIVQIFHGKITYAQFTSHITFDLEKLGQDQVMTLMMKVARNLVNDGD